MIENIIKKEIENHYEEMVSIRRYLHQNPELSFFEKNTAQYIKDYLKNIGVSNVKTEVGLHGIVATINSNSDTTLAFRADFDALPIEDNKNVSYKSKTSHVMHACGHDGHTATLLIVCKILMKHIDKLTGNIVAIFQYGEEQAPGGAKPMIDSGCLNNVDAIFGVHLWTPLDVGTVGYSHKELCAAADRFEINISNCKNANLIGAELISTAQQIVSRFSKPRETIVLTFGTLHSTLENGNILGTLRTFNKNLQSLALTKLNALCDSLASQHDCHINFIYHGGYPAVINNSNAVDIGLLALQSNNYIKKTIEVEPLMIGEDFAYYLEKIPGAFFLIGAGNDSYAKYPHHNPNFDFVEDAMAYSANLFLQLAFNSKSIVNELKETK